MYIASRLLPSSILWKSNFFYNKGKWVSFVNPFNSFVFQQKDHCSEQASLFQVRVRSVYRKPSPCDIKRESDCNRIQAWKRSAKESIPERVISACVFFASQEKVFVKFHREKLNGRKREHTSDWSRISLQQPRDSLCFIKLYNWLRQS